MKKYISYFLIIISIFTLSSCGEEEKNGNAHFGGSIKIFAYTPDTFNPIETKYKTNAALFADTIYCPLVRVEKDLALTPVIAKTWKFSDNNTKLTVTLRDDLKFSDGTKVSAKHAKNVIDAIQKNPESLYSPLNEYVSECSASGNTLILHLKKRGMGVLYTLDIPIYKDKTSLLGCGSYVLKEKKEDRFVLSSNTEKNANDAFEPNIETVEVIYFPTEEAAVNAFNASEMDAVSCNINTLSTLSAKTDVKSVDYINEKFTYLGFNCEAASVASPQIRSAINTLIDKNNLVETMLAGYAEATNSPFRPNSIFNNTHPKSNPFDTNNANETLKKETFQSFSLLINKESSSKKTVAEYIKEKLREYGITVQIISVSYEDYLKKINENDYTAYIGELIIPADQDLSFLLRSDTTLLNYGSEDMDKCLDAFSSAIYENERVKQAENIQKLVSKDTPIISLYYEKEMFFVSNKIKSEVTPQTNSLYRNICKWYVK